MSVQFGRFPGLGRLSAFAAAFAITAVAAQPAAAVDPVLVDNPSYYLNEVFFDSQVPSSDDDEYFEVRQASGTGGSLANLWFIQLENEDTSGNNPGIIDFAYPLSGNTNGSGFAWFGNTGHDFAAAPGTNGTFANGSMENSGGTFLLVNTGGLGTNPAGGHVWDSNIDGTFDTNFDSRWQVLDAIGVVSETDDLSTARLYSYINFAVGSGASIDVPTGAIVVNTNSGSLDGADNGANPDNANAFDEIEYVGRYGNTTGRVAASVDDWIAANLTDKHSGWNATNSTYGVSGDHDDDNMPESVRGDNIVSPHAYGHIVTNTQGAANSVSYTPEPASFAMAAVGGVALMGMARRRRF